MSRWRLSCFNDAPVVSVVDSMQAIAQSNERTNLELRPQLYECKARVKVHVVGVVHEILVTLKIEISAKGVVGVVVILADATWCRCVARARAQVAFGATVGSSNRALCRSDRDRQLDLAYSRTRRCCWISKRCCRVALHYRNEPSSRAVLAVLRTSDKPPLVWYCTPVSRSPRPKTIFPVECSATQPQAIVASVSRAAQRERSRSKPREQRQERAARSTAQQRGFAVRARARASCTTLGERLTVFEDDMPLCKGFRVRKQEIVG